MLISKIPHACLVRPLLFISKTHGISCSHTLNSKINKTLRKPFASVSNEISMILVTHFLDKKRWNIGENFIAQFVSETPTRKKKKKQEQLLQSVICKRNNVFTENVLNQVQIQIKGNYESGNKKSFCFRYFCRLLTHALTLNPRKTYINVLLEQLDNFETPLVVFRSYYWLIKFCILNFFCVAKLLVLFSKFPKRVE